MKSAELRKTFLDFYAARDHQVVPSAPLVPRADPTLMFVNAGMVQFKDVFTGKERRPYTRATSSQKCIRISGKHNDLENVGVTARHHTFFEMLGNFSFGDYFKEEAIVSAWEFLTKVLDMSTERMVVTVFKGEDGFPADDEAAAIWRKVTGFSDDRVLRLGKEDNFWSMGDTGPCGPCSEIHYFHGPDVDVSRFGEEPRSDGTGWTEIWNLVFMQFDRPEKGAPAVPLPANSVDTGAGLERMACVVQGVTSNYDTDVLRRLIARIEDIAKKSYRATAEDDDVSMRVIADHARTTAFLIAEGVLPDKQRREYVLRRVMRRAIRHGHRLGIDRPFLHQVALEVVDAMGADYPELVERRQLIERVSEGEEIRFRVTLKRGMKILDEHFESDQALLPEIVADLYTTYGFPLDLTEVIARERGTAIDLEAARKIVQTAEDTAEGPIDPDAAVAPVYREVAQRVKATNFSGYETERDESRIVALIVDGALVDRANAGEVEIAVERTPFYAEAGGQVGDRGTLRTPSARARVDNTYRPFGDVTLHRARVEQGSLAVGDAVELEVDHALRASTRRNHSATHLLHWALKQVLGEHAQQKGSLVGPDVLRFDFAHNAPLTREQVEQVEDLVNAKILSNAPVQTNVLPIDEARKSGAVAIFEEKYGDVVRVLTMTPDSVELCGGTHCRALGDIGLFKITSEGGTAAGVRRIFAATGENALHHVRELEHDMQRARTAAKAHGTDLAGKIEKLLAYEKDLERRIKQLEKQLLEGGGSDGVEQRVAEARTIGDVKVLHVDAGKGTQAATLREIGEKIRDKLGPRAVVLAGSISDKGDKALLALMVSKEATDKLDAGKLIRQIASHIGGSGGGRADMAQAGGTRVEGYRDAMNAVYDAVQTSLEP